MGLVLTSSESLDSDLASSFLTEHRHFQSRPHLNPHAKHPRRPFHWSSHKSSNRHEIVDASPLFLEANETLPPHHLALYHANIARHRTPRYNPPVRGFSRRGNKFHSVDGTEGLALARAKDVRLPSDSDRRMPSLEREDAFWDGRTCKAKRKREDMYYDCVSQGSSQERTDSQQSQEEVRELYRMGILYEDEHLRGEGFSLEAVERERSVGVGEGMWNVRYRPVKRRGRAARRREIGFEGLNLELSFARLGEDEALRGFLVGDEEEGDDGEGGIFEMEGVVPTYAEVVGRTMEVGCDANVDEATGAVAETIEERVARIKRRIAELTGDEAVDENAVEDDDDEAVDEEQDNSVASIKPATEETVNQRVARIKSELGALYQKTLEDQASTNSTSDDMDNRDEAYYQDLITRFDKLKRKPVEEADNDEENDWALLDFILDGSGSGNDTATAASVDTCDADDTWIVLGSNGS